MIDKEREYLESIIEKGKRANELLVERLRCEGTQGGLNKALNTMNDVLALACKSSDMTFEIDITDSEFAREKIFEIIRHESILNNRKLDEINLKIKNFE